MKRSKSLLLAAVLLFGLALPGHGDPMYLLNRRYSGHVRTDGSGAPWVRVMEFIRAAGIYPGAVSVTPPYKGAVKVAYQGKTFSLPADESAPDGVYVPARLLVEGLGGRWTANSAQHIIDVYLVPSKAAGGPAKPATVELETQEGLSPLKIDTFTYLDPTQPGNFADYRIHGTLVVENTGDSYADAVDLSVHLADGNNNDVAVLEKHVGRVEPGQQIRWDWEWNNVTLAVIHPVAEAVCDPYLTATQRQQKKTAHGLRLSVRSTATGLPPAIPGDAATQAPGLAPATLDTPTPGPPSGY